MFERYRPFAAPVGAGLLLLRRAEDRRRGRYRLSGVATEPCSWCGGPVETDGGFRACEPDADRRAVFCRLEHVVPWVIQGAHWSPGTILEEDDDPDGLGACVRCGAELDDKRVLLVRHRGEHRIADSFCGPEHLLEWAKNGGRWA